MGLPGELDLVFEAAQSLSYGTGRLRAAKSAKYCKPPSNTRPGNGCCTTCGEPSHTEQFVVYRPNEEKMFRTQTTCRGRPPCPVVVNDRANAPPEKRSEGESIVNSMPKCACGCGRQVKGPGRKLASRQCIGAYNSKKRVWSPRSEASGLLEESIRLAGLVPRDTRAQFFQKVVELVNSAEDITAANTYRAP